MRKLKNGKRKPYARDTVHGWYRVLRTMTRDAMDDLRLERDPTLRISFPPARSRSASNSLSSEELARFLTAMRERFPHHFAITAVLAFTGLRFCHASALRWEDWERETGVLRIMRKQVRGQVGEVSRKKRAPRECPVEPDLALILREHRKRMLAEQAPGLESGWMFPSQVGTLRAPSSLEKAWLRCLKVAGINRRFTIHGLRYTFTDLVRRAKADAVVRRALTGHVTEAMQDHYSSVGLEEKRSAVAKVHRLVADSGSANHSSAQGNSIAGGTLGGTLAEKEE
jgi:integrase